MRRLRGCADRPTERGTALVLAPTLVLVLLVLGAIAADLALVHGARRSAYRSLTAAADDAAAMVDSAELQRSGSIRIDPDAARRVALAHLGLLDGQTPGGFSPPAFTVTDAEVHVDPASGTVMIDAVVSVERVLGSALPGMDETVTFRVSATGMML